MADQFQKAKIKVTGTSSPKEGMYVIESGKDKYSFFEKKQDGTETQAFETFKSLNVGIGKEIGITFTTTTKKNQYGNEVTYKNVKTFVDPSSIEVQSRNLNQEIR